MAAIRAAERGADAEALLGEVEADARVAAEAVELAPDDLRGVDAALHHEVFDQPAEIVDGQGGDAVARLPQHLRMARATLYSPPPSHTWKLRALRTRPKPGSKRSITSPNEAQSQRVSAAGLNLQNVVGHVMLLTCRGWS